MEKTGAISPDATPEPDRKAGEKKAAAPPAERERLADGPQKRLAERAEDRLKK